MTIVCTQKSPEVAQAYIVKKINEWCAKNKDIMGGVRASEVDGDDSKPVVQVEEFGYDSAVRFSMGGGLVGDDWPGYGPILDLDKSPHVCVEAINSWSFRVYPVQASCTPPLRGEPRPFVQPSIIFTILGFFIDLMFVYYMCKVRQADMLNTHIETKKRRQLNKPIVYYLQEEEIII